MASERIEETPEFAAGLSEGANIAAMMQVQRIRDLEALVAALRPFVEAYAIEMELQEWEEGNAECGERALAARQALAATAAAYEARVRAEQRSGKHQEATHEAD